MTSAVDLEGLLEAAVALIFALDLDGLFLVVGGGVSVTVAEAGDGACAASTSAVASGAVVDALEIGIVALGRTVGSIGAERCGIAGSLFNNSAHNIPFHPHCGGCQKLLYFS